MIVRLYVCVQELDDSVHSMRVQLEKMKEIAQKAQVCGAGQRPALRTPALSLLLVQKEGGMYLNMRCYAALNV